MGGECRFPSCLGFPGEGPKDRPGREEITSTSSRLESSSGSGFSTVGGNRTGSRARSPRRNTLTQRRQDATGGRDSVGENPTPTGTLAHILQAQETPVGRRTRSRSRDDTTFMELPQTSRSAVGRRGRGFHSAAADRDPSPPLRLQGAAPPSINHPGYETQDTTEERRAPGFGRIEASGSPIQHGGSASAVTMVDASTMTTEFPVDSSNMTDAHRTWIGVHTTGYCLGSRPLRRTQSYADVARLLEEAWLMGPNEALCVSRLHEKLVLLLSVDTAARPSDIANLFRTTSEVDTHIRFTGNDMDLRYFGDREDDQNSPHTDLTKTYAGWIRVHGTDPPQIDTVRVMRAFLDRVRSDYLLYGDLHAFFGHMSDETYADHLSNITQSAINRADMGGMQTAYLRAASSCKIAQLVPNMRIESIRLGRWGSESTFAQYERPVVGVWAPVPTSVRGSCQWILRHGFAPKPPPKVSRTEYEAAPTSWTGEYIRGEGRITPLSDGEYLLGGDRVSHRTLMQRLSHSRLQ